jgi:hypothetical protein
LLLVMGAISYVFVLRGLAHTHQLTSENLETIKGVATGQPAGLQGKTSLMNGHRHKVIIAASGKSGKVQTEQRHTHSLTVKKDGGKTLYELGPEEGMLTARVPVYGKLSFRDRQGQPSEKGINVGDEWQYRSYVEGGGMAAAIWTFDGVTENRFPKGLPVEITLEVFRTHKGNINKGVAGLMFLRNPATGVQSAEQVFESKEFVADLHTFPRELESQSGKKLDLFKDLVSDGKIEVWVRCGEPQQNFGMSQADMYLRAGDAPFWWNFVKGYIGIWLQLLIVVTIGVMFSTFLSGPVAMVATLAFLLGGLFREFVLELAMGPKYGGGPFESLYRLLTQDNMVVELPEGLVTTVVRVLDQPAEFGLWLVGNVLPEFGRFNFSERVASGFNIPGDTLLAYTCRAFAFVLPVFVAAYLCLRNREVAR